MDSIKLLFIGNSFAVDTIHYFADVAKSFGVKKIKIWTLYIGGCSINKHYDNLINDKKDYTCFINEGNGWIEKNGYGIKDSITSESWDYIAIQHGTNDKSRYSDINSYANLSNLVNMVKEIANKNTKIIFNMTWIGETSFPHEEIIAFNKDQEKLYDAVYTLTKENIVTMDNIDIVCPTGVAIQNARKVFDKLLTRDGYHLSLDLGRFIASLTLYKAITNKIIDKLDYLVENIDINDKNKIIDVVNNSSFK